MSQEQTGWTRSMPLERRISLSKIFLSLRKGFAGIYLDEILTNIKRKVDIILIESDISDKEDLEIKLLEYMSKQLHDEAIHLKSKRAEERNPSPKKKYQPELAKGFTYGT
jgi:hypothetical protein